MGLLPNRVLIFLLSFAVAMFEKIRFLSEFMEKYGSKMNRISENDP